MVTAPRELSIPNMVQPNLMQGWLAPNKWKLEAGDPTNTRSYQVEQARQEQRRMVMNVASYYPMMGVQGTGLATSYLAGLAYDGAYGLRDDLYVLATDRAHQAGLSETPALHLNGQMATGQERLDAHMSAYITAFTLFTPSGVARAGRGVAAAGEGSAVAAEQGAARGTVAGAAKDAPKLLNQFNSVESLLQNAGKLTRLKGGARQGFVAGNADDIFTGLSKQYGAKIQTGASGQQFFQSGNIRVDLTGSSGNIPTLRINNNGKLFKIRVQ